ncbi:MAG: ATP synthase subunit I [Clostridiales bacterium]|nr:ATP synthase subunit I [Clostridiales bacterium]
MKVDGAIKKETKYIALTVLILSALMEAVYLIIGKWELPVLLGNLMGGTVGVLNFFLMGLGLQSALDKDEKGAKSTVAFSHSMRFLLMAAVIVIAVLVDVFAIVPTVLGLFFPSVGVYFKTMKLKTGSVEDMKE